MVLPVNRAAGNTIQATDINDVAQEVNDANQHFLTTGEETMPRMFAFQSNVTAATQVLKLTYFSARKTETITQVRMTSGGTAAATITLCRIGIYSVAGNGDITLVASTPNDTALFAGTFTRYTKSLSASWAKAAGTRYALGVLTVGTTMPHFYGLSIGFDHASEPPRLGGAVTAQSDLPSSVVSASISSGSNAGHLYYATMLP